jgi:polysaccharide pyruvyl transferase WcaK-like protein
MRSRLGRVYSRPHYSVPELNAVIEGLLDPAMALAVFGSLDAAVCMRYHSLLFAARSDTPILALPYAPKCDAWLDEHDLQAVESGPGEMALRLQAVLANRMAA